MVPPSPVLDYLESLRVRFSDLADGKVLRAEHGVILTAGTIGSPLLLMRSGVGDAEDLRKVGVTPRHDLSGVQRGDRGRERRLALRQRVARGGEELQLRAAARARSPS
mgnify:CR=1 FL=1